MINRKCLLDYRLPCHKSHTTKLNGQFAPYTVYTAFPIYTNYAQKHKNYSAVAVASNTTGLVCMR